MISTIREAKNDYYQVSDSVLQIGHLWAGIGFSENFTLKAPKCNYRGENQITR